MFDIQAVEIFSFIKQLGLAVAGASALWGLVLLRGAKQADDLEKREVCNQLAEKVLLPFGLGTLLSILGWIALFFVSPVATVAHEGIVLDPYMYENINGFGFINILFVFLALLSAWMFGSYQRSRISFNRNVRKFYTGLLAVISVLVGVPVWTGSFGIEQLFFFGHNFHSIITVGTVLLLDYMFFTTESSPIIKRQLYPLLPTASKAIWIGLSIEFLSVSLIFGEALTLTPKFFFMQTIIAVLIINGAFLAGPVNRKLMDSVSGNGSGKLIRRWKLIAGITGVISISSWMTITFLDFIKNTTASYLQLGVAYIGVIALVYVGYQVVERLRPRF